MGIVPEWVKFETDLISKIMYESVAGGSSQHALD
jgi:hypothetical protein